MTIRRTHASHAIPTSGAPRRVARFAVAAGAVVLLGALLPAPVLLAAGTTTPTAVAAPVPLPDFAPALAADGTFHGAPGNAGTVDPKAWTLVSDPDKGEPPRFAPATAAATIAGPWSAFGSNGAGDGAINGAIHAVAVSGTDLYVGGSFTNAGGHVGANYLAKWNGFSWSAVGAPSALNDQVDAIVISGSNVYVGGRFTNAADIAKADHVAKWNGSAWSALGSNVAGTNGALNTWVQALAVSGGDLYAGGWFTNAGGIAQADYVAKWNGSAWSALGSVAAIAPSPFAPSPAVDSLAVSGTDLYVGGSFIDVAGIVEADDIAKWNGSAWSALGSGDCNTGCGAIDGAVYALAVSGTDLYVGGGFTNVGSLDDSVPSPLDNVVRWDGSTWSALGSNGAGDGALGEPVYALAVVGTDIYVGGDLYDAAGISTGDRIARWDGAAWNAMGSGGPDGGAINGDVNALAASASGADLYVGGWFTDTAGIMTADQVALWGPPIVVRKPDGRIRLGTGAYVGNNVYNTTGSSQSRTGSALRGHYVTFGISIQNDGTNADTFRVKATGTSTTKYGVKYYRGTIDITSAVVAGTYSTSSLAVGSTFYITAKVLVKSTATVGSSVTRLVTVTSVGNTTKKDAVKLTGKRP